MIKKIKSVLNEFRGKHLVSQRQLSELEWANIFHDSIKGVPEIEKLSINVGRWAGNYSFFYILNRILNDFKPKSILEFGLGESSKLVSTYISKGHLSSKYVILEHDNEWKEHFLSRYKLPKNVIVKEQNLTTLEVNGYSVCSYEGVESHYEDDIEFFIIDGPFGSERYSRYDIVKLVQLFKVDKRFIILIDDYQRQGEKDTSQAIYEHLRKSNISFDYSVFKGAKEQLLISSNHYKFLHSI